MATVTKPSWGIPLQSVFSSPKPPSVRKRRWLRLGGILLGTGVILLWVLPTLIAHSFLLEWIVGYLAADFQGEIHVGEASLGWFRPLQFQQIEILDTQQRQLAWIGRVTGDRTLWSLLWNHQDLGRWVVEDAQVNVVLRPDGSNWEDGLAHYLVPSDSSTTAMKLEVEVHRSKAVVEEIRSGRSWRLDDLQAVVRIPPSSAQPWQLLCTGQAIPIPTPSPTETKASSSDPETVVPEASGQFQLELTWGGHPPQEESVSQENRSNGGILIIYGQQVPLGLAEAVLMRWEPLIHLEGCGSGWLEYAWGEWSRFWAARSPAGKKAESLPQRNGEVSAAVSDAPWGPHPLSEPLESHFPTRQKTPDHNLPLDAVVIRGHVSSEEAKVGWSGFLRETLFLSPLEWQGSIIWTNEYLLVKDFQLRCQAGELSAAGRLDLRSEAMADWLAALGRHPYQLEGRLDLAQLARLLPQTLRLQEGIQVTSGQFQIALFAQPGTDGMIWQGRIFTHDLKALHEGRTLAWPEPLRVTFDAHEGPEGLVLESLQCTSEFLRLDAFGTQHAMSVSAQMDLDRLSQRLKEWVNWGDVQLAGKGALSLTWTKQPNDRFDADLIVQGDRLRVLIPQWAVQITEDVRAKALLAGTISGTAPPTAQTRRPSDTSSGSDLQSRSFLSSSGNWPTPSAFPYGIGQIDSAVLLLQLGQDQGEIRLRQPVPSPGPQSRWPVEVRLEGPLADWVRRLRPWLDIQSCQLDGHYALAASLEVAPESLQIHSARMAAAPFHLNALGGQVAEPRMDLALSGRWDWGAGRFELIQARLQMNPLLLDAQNLCWEPGGLIAGEPRSAKSSQTPSLSGPRFTGQVQVQGTLDQLLRWFSPTRSNGWSMSGAFNGSIEFQSDSSGTAGTGQIRIQNFSYTASPGSPPWKQAEVQLAAEAHYDHQTGLLQLTSTRLQGEGIGYAGTAQIRPPAPSAGPQALRTYQAVGQLQYDWQKLTPLLRTYWGAGILLQGQDRQQFRWQGPLDFALAEASLGLGWQALEVYGFQGGPATIRGQLSQGWLHITPVEMTLNEGKLRAAGTIRLSPSPMELVVEKGTSAHQIRITPQMCASAFQYIAPVLADVTRVEGRVSLLLDVCRVPLSNPAASQIQGRFVIHSIHLGPSPLVQELATLLIKDPTARLRNEAVIPFTMTNGRVYHERLELVFPEITIRTQGYVGLDQSLALTAEMPILPKWTAMNPRLATAFQGQTIRIPIRGTLHRPQLDQQTLRRYAAQFLQKSTENLLQDELQRQMDRLLKRPSP